MQTTFEIETLSTWLHKGWNMYQAESNQDLMERLRTAMRTDMAALKSFYGLSSLTVDPSISDHDGDYGQPVLSCELEVLVQKTDSAEVELDDAPDSMLTPDGGQRLAEFKDVLASVNNLINEKITV